MTTTPDNATTPNVPLPAGAVADNDAWAIWDNEARVFRGRDRVVLNGAGEVIAEVRTSGLQLSDGSVDNGEDRPEIDVQMFIGDGLTRGRPASFAAALLEAAAEIDRWASR